MAEAKEEDHKKSGVLRWIILPVSLIVLGGGGFFSNWKFSCLPAPETALAAETEKSHGEAKSEGKEESEKGGKHVDLMVPLDSFVVNLADPPPARRYMKIKVDAQMADEKAAAGIKDKMVVIRDSILMLLSSKTSLEVSSMEGKLAMRKEIAEKINLALEGPKVVRVFYTELVIQ